MEVTTGQTNEGEMIETQVDEVEATTGVDIKTITVDDGRQTRMVGQFLVQAVADEPANGDVNLSLAHWLAVMGDTREQASEHQPHRYLWINSGSAIVDAIAVGDFSPEPRQVEHAVDSCQHVFI